MPTKAALAHPSILHPAVLWWMLLMATLLWDTSGLDLTVMRLIGTPSGFALRNDWWLERVLHTGLRQLTTGLFLLTGVWACWPTWVASSQVQPIGHTWPRRLGLHLPRGERIAVAALVTLSLLTISTLKHFSLTSCPWDWQIFGGTAQQTSHWRPWLPDGGPGRCFPGGHASSAFAFLPLAFPWLLPPRSRTGEADRRPGAGWWWMGLIVSVGLVAGAAQTLRGAHPPSHTLWTLLICGAVSGVGWHWSQALMADRVMATGR